MRRKKISRRKPRAPRRALLIDLENLAYAGVERLDAPTVGDRLRGVLVAAGDVSYILVVAPRHAIERHGAQLASLGLRWEMCAAGQDSADQQVVQRANDPLGFGFVEIIVSSGDHYFSRLAPLTKLCVVVPDGVPIAAELRRVSHQIVAA